MTCAEIDRLLPAYADGEFDDGEQVEFEIHLAHCQACRGRVSAHHAFGAAMRAKAGISPAPASLRQRIRGDIHRARMVSQAQRYAVYAAVAAGVAGIASIGFVTHPPHPIDADYLTRTSLQVRNLPLDFETTSGDLAAWAGQHVSFNPRVPRFDAAQLRGVRQHPVNDRTGLVFVWPRSTLQVFPDDDVRLVVAGNTHHVGDRDVVVASHNGYNVAYWRDGGLVYSLVSDLDERSVLQLLQQMEGR